MNLSGLLTLIEIIPEFNQLVTALRGQTTVTADVIESARGPMLAALSRVLKGPIVVLTARTDRAKQLATNSVSGLQTTTRYSHSLNPIRFSMSGCHGMPKRLPRGLARSPR